MFAFAGSRVIARQSTPCQEDERAGGGSCGGDREDLGWAVEVASAEML